LTNPNSPFGVAQGYPAGTRITDKQQQAQILQDQAGFSATLARASTSGPFDPTRTLRPIPLDFSAVGPEHYQSIGLMQHGSVAQEFFERRNNQDLRKLEQAYQQHSDPARALADVFESRGYAPPMSTPTTMAGARQEVSRQAEAYTGDQFARAQSHAEQLGFGSVADLPDEATKGELFAGKLIAGQVKRNVSKPMAFSEALGIAQQQLGSEAGHTVPIIQGQRLEPESESEKKAFSRANKQVKGGEPQVQQSFSDLTTVVKELSNALKDLTKSAKPQESKGDLIQKRHDLAMEQQRDRQQFTTARDEYTAGQKETAHERSIMRQERGGMIRQGHIQLQHELAMEKQKDAQEHQIKIEERREQHREKMAGGRRKGGLTEFALGAMHRGDVLRLANFSGRMARRAIGGAFNMAMGVAGGSSIAQSIGSINPFGVPVGALTALPMQMLRNIAGQGAEMELTALQAQFLNTGQMRQQGRLMESGYTVDTIMGLSTELGISPSQSASLLKDVGVADPNNSFSISDLSSLAVRGINPSQVAQIGGQLGMLNAGLGSRDVIGLMNKSGMRGNQAMDFASRIADFTRGRRVAGLGIGGNFLRDTASRVQSMGVGVEAGLATLGKVQGTALQAGQGLTSMFGGMVDLAIQASAFEQAGGDLFKAVGISERISGSPRELLTTLEGQGMSDELINIALTGKQFTTGQVRQIRQIRKARGGGEFDTDIPETITENSLVVSRRLAQRQQADIKQLYSTTGKDGESMITKLDAMLTADTKYQEAVLKTMVKASQIENIGSAVTDLTTVVAKTNVLISGMADFLRDFQDHGLRKALENLL
tara:strand:- start:8552 stop:11026 length:2475 start_codon:yes stop_codon:yes gene_type:complete